MTKSCRTRRRSQRDVLSSASGVAKLRPPASHVSVHLLTSVLCDFSKSFLHYSKGGRQFLPTSRLQTQLRVQATHGSKACACCRARLSQRARARTLYLSARARTPSARMPLRPATPAPTPPHKHGTPTLGLPRRFLWVFRCLDAHLRSRCRAPLPGIARRPPLRADTCLRPSTGPKALCPVLVVKEALALERAEQLRCAAHPSRPHTRSPNPTLLPGPAARPPRRPRPGPNCTQPALCPLRCSHAAVPSGPGVFSTLTLASAWTQVPRPSWSSSSSSPSPIRCPQAPTSRAPSPSPPRTILAGYKTEGVTVMYQGGVSVKIAITLLARYSLCMCTRALLPDLV